MIDAERRELSRSAERSETPPLDAELLADGLYIGRTPVAVPSEVRSVDSRRVPVIHNAFWIAGKVPSLNELLAARGSRATVFRSIIIREKPNKDQRSGVHDLYNDIKREWMKRTVQAVPEDFTAVSQAYFGYLIIEETLRRDPSNFCSAAIKFIEDGLIKAKVIPNDSWDNVLGIRVHWLHRSHRISGVLVVMSDVRLSEEELVSQYAAVCP